MGDRLVGGKRTLKTGKLRNLNLGSSSRSTDDESRKDIEGGINRMGDRAIWGRGQISGEREIESVLKASNLNNWGVDNEFKMEHAEFEVPSRHPGRNSQWGGHR